MHYSISSYLQYRSLQYEIQTDLEIIYKTFAFNL